MPEPLQSSLAVPPDWDRATPRQRIELGLVPAVKVRLHKVTGARPWGHWRSAESFARSIAALRPCRPGETANPLGAPPDAQLRARLLLIAAQPGPLGQAVRDAARRALARPVPPGAKVKRSQIVFRNALAAAVAPESRPEPARDGRQQGAEQAADHATDLNPNPRRARKEPK